MNYPIYQVLVMSGQKATNYPFNLRQNLNELAKKLAKNWMAKKL